VPVGTRAPRRATRSHSPATTNAGRAPRGDAPDAHHSRNRPGPAAPRPVVEVSDRSSRRRAPAGLAGRFVRSVALPAPAGHCRLGAARGLRRRCRGRHRRRRRPGPRRRSMSWSGAPSGSRSVRRALSSASAVIATGRGQCRWPGGRAVCTPPARWSTSRRPSPTSGPTTASGSTSSTPSARERRCASRPSSRALATLLTSEAVAGTVLDLLTYELTGHVVDIRMSPRGGLGPDPRVVDVKGNVPQFARSPAGCTARCPRSGQLSARRGGEFPDLSDLCLRTATAVRASDELARRRALQRRDRPATRPARLLPAHRRRRGRDRGRVPVPSGSGRRLHHGDRAQPTCAAAATSCSREPLQRRRQPRPVPGLPGLHRRPARQPRAGRRGDAASRRSALFAEAAGSAAVQRQVRPTVAGTPGGRSGTA
jgi:hypothetical protein